MSHTYPETVIEILDDQMQFPNDVVAAVQHFAETGPWRGSRREREEKFRTLMSDLAEVYEIEPPALIFRHIDGGHSGQSYYDRASHQIVLSRRFSVVTCLHEFGHVLGMNERAACKWSVNLFKRCFPAQYSNLIHVGHMLVRPADLVRRSRDLKPGRGILARMEAKRKSFEDCSRTMKSGR